MDTTAEIPTLPFDDDIDNGDAKIFPQKLMEILSDPANENAIAWHPNGKVFTIMNRQKFSKNILPKYFRKTKYTSFTRKLNRWNFLRLTRGRQQSTYCHEFFQRGEENLCTQMYCNNDRAKFAAVDKHKKNPQPNFFQLQNEGSKEPLLAPATTNVATPNLYLSQDLSEAFPTPQDLPNQLYDVPNQSFTANSDQFSLLYSMNHVQLLKQDLQTRSVLLKQQEDQLKTELIKLQREDLYKKQQDWLKKQQAHLLKKQQAHLLFKQEQGLQLLRECQQQHLAQPVMSNTTAILGSHQNAQTRQLLEQQQILENKATCLRLQLALMQQQSLPVQDSLKCRASAA